MSEPLKLKNSRKPRTHAGKKKGPYNKDYQEFQIFVKEMKQKHAGQIEWCKTMRDMLKDVKKNYTPTEHSDIQQFNRWVRYNNKRLMYQQDYEPLVPLETEEIKNIETSSPAPNIEAEIEKEVSVMLPDIPDTSFQTNKDVDVQSDCEDLGFN